MTLIKSISGIRGTIGGKAGDALTPPDIVGFTYAYCKRLRERIPKEEGQRYKVVVGKDARLSGDMVEQLVCGTLCACGVDVVKAGFCSTPTTEMAVTFAKADGGIILTASHNPRQWNALKLLNEHGEFLSAEEGGIILEYAAEGDFDFADVDSLGSVSSEDFTSRHLDAIMALSAVDAGSIRKAGFRVVLDAVNSVGGIIMPQLLERLGVECICLNCTPDGNFAHNPEPLPGNLVQLREKVVSTKADLGISVDPDVDRLAFICENGEPFVEEYTLVSVADYLFGRIAEAAFAEGKTLEEVTGPVYKPIACSNLSSSRALRDVAEKYGASYVSSAVGEVNVTTLMHETLAVIGGEGNGGVIYPELHYGRDAMVGTALFLSQLARKKMKASELKATLPEYHIAKDKIQLSDPELIGTILSSLKEAFSDEEICEIDGVKISFPEKRSWVHLRRSNTEPIIRIYAEAPREEDARALADKVLDMAREIIDSQR